MLSALADSESIRDVSHHDIDDIMEIEEMSFPTPWTRRLFEETLGSPISSSFVLEKGGRVLGYIILYWVLDEAHILNIAIHPRFRRKGYAARLIRYVLGHCEAQGVRNFFLEVREGNVAALGLYQQIGFEQIGRRKNYYAETNEDALVMHLSLHSFGVEGWSSE